MPVVDGRSEPRGPMVLVETSAVAELEWVMDSAMHADWRAGHPDLEGIHRSEPELAVALQGLWSPEQATSCGGFLELTVLAQLCGQLFGTNADAFLDALPDAMAKAPVDALQLPLHSESDDDRRVVLSRLAALRRSKSMRNRYVEVAGHAWAAARPVWEHHGRASVERAVQQWGRQLDGGTGWQDLSDNPCAAFTDHLPKVVSAIGANAQIALLPSYFAHKGFYVDVKNMLLVSVRSQPSTPVARRRSEGLARQLKTISDPTRLAILDALRRSPRSVTELAAEFSLSQPTVSNHVRLLREGGLVTDERHGRRRQLTVSAEAVERLMSAMHEMLGLESAYDKG